jgi:hypothetical protein
MKLPGGDQAIIDPRKVIDYCLNPDHEDGQHKARLFASILGLTINHADQLLRALRTAAATEKAVMSKQDKYGQRYLVDFEFRGQAATATIRSAWIIRPDETVPRLVTCYIL